MSNDNHSHHFIVPVKYYVGTYIALLFLTFVTVAIAQVDFGDLNIYFGMTVAFFKASIVALIFMGLKWDKGFNKIIFFSSILFLFLFIIITWTDLFFRQYKDPLEGEQINLETGVKLIPEGKQEHH